MAKSRQNILEKAQSRLLETQKKTADRNKATAEYQSEAKARAIKTARLRELRLAKEETERAAEAALKLSNLKPKKKRASRAGKSKRLSAPAAKKTPVPCKRSKDE